MQSSTGSLESSRNRQNEYVETAIRLGCEERSDGEAVFWLGAQVLASEVRAKAAAAAERDKKSLRFGSVMI